MSFAADLTTALDRTEQYVLDQDFRGWDPFDGLMSPCWNWPGLRSWRRPRWAWQQVVKRLPTGVRPLLGIRAGRNPVTLALCLQGLAYRDAAAPEPRRADRLESLIADLAAVATPGHSGPCWGYDFFWEARYASNPPFHPTVVATGFVVNALWELLQGGARSGTAADLVRDAARFVVDDLNRTDAAGGFCWSYSPTDNQAVINASLKGARICAQAVDLGAPAALLEPARMAVAHAVAMQRPDGAWPYSVSDSRSWVDHFHTGYVLDCLDAWIGLTGETEHRPALDRGWRFYRDSFFTDDGAPRYYHDRTWPIDASSCGQALLTLVRFGDVDQACRVAAWSLRHLARPDGAFFYQKTRTGTRRSIYMRWSVAWMLLGLSSLEAALAR